MIKASVRMSSGRQLIVIGLSDLNLQKLQEGKPIHMDLESMGLLGEMYIFNGRTEAEMARTLAEFVGADTKVIMPEDMKS